MFVTAFYSIFVKFVLYILFLKYSFLFINNYELEYTSALSLIVGCIGTLRQVEIKRFLAYSSITHMGFLLTGDFTSSVVYLASYILASLAIFSILLTLNINGSEFIYLSDLRNLSNTAGGESSRTLMAFSLASMSGLPPFAGFYGKFLVWASLIEDILLFNDLFSYLMLALHLATSLIIIFYYVRIIILIYLGGDEQAITASAQEATTDLLSPMALKITQTVTAVLLVA